MKRPSPRTAPYPPLDGAVRHDTEIAVRYVETDQMGVVHHANYLVWFELARTNLCATSGTTYAAIEQRGFWLMVTGAHLSYRGGARYGDIVRVGCRIARESSRLVDFEYEVRIAETTSVGTDGSEGSEGSEPDPRIGQVVVTGTTQHAWVDAATRRTARLPDDLRAIFLRLAGKS
ncbi:MAG: acyl-CoA thioesterase [Acidobacteria bacterium]|nr:MAG: acyl-CoA thioesterase [Acidobacteriota bacterium]REK04301.1 MAG: acyl-CoA thioesterase [Acidobacteriota bacterium]